MQKVLTFLIVVVVFQSAAAESDLPQTPPGQYFALSAKDHQGAQTFQAGQPVVGTSYFYWYDVDSKAHIFNGDGSDAFTTHPPTTKGLSYKSTAWHQTQLRDMIEAGVDFLVPVYWGIPGKYSRWSFAGLPPLVKAHDALLDEGLAPPAIGLFFDSSILRHNSFQKDGSNVHVDLSTEWGFDYFYTSIRDYFSLIPPDKWARVDGKPILFLYTASFSKQQSPNQFDQLRRRFQADFSVEPFIVKMRDWQGTADAVYQWGGSVRLQIDSQVAALGPGYDHTAVPGRKPLVVERNNGKTYVDRWKQLLQLHPDRRPWMIHVETWNEWHEGTDIAESREYGRTYLVLTRLFADLWHTKTQTTPHGKFSGSRQVDWKPGMPNGVTVDRNIADGAWSLRRLEDFAAVVSQHHEGRDQTRYLYFSVDDSFAFDRSGEDMELEVHYLDAGCQSLSVQYDSFDTKSSVRDGAFRSTDTQEIQGSGQWSMAKFTLPACRFANRCNGADLRIAILGGERELAVRRVVLCRK